MARHGRIGFLAIAVVFHLIYILSIFDIYFVSPIVSGMQEFRVERADGEEAPAKRLVLFVGDGLRADKAFQSFPDPSPSDPTDPDALIPRPLAPFLRSRVLEHGTFGVSHTRVPTESRPGHVALIAGLYEDVSSVTTGWKLNPVNFDSVFNRSRHTWSWGSPDILPMFKEGAVPGRVSADTYAEEAEDFTRDATLLDTWVFDRVKQLFSSAVTDPSLDTALREDGNVFFLHLLGLDTSGHAHRPYSKEYLHNIKVVDEGVREITKLIETFYADGKTAFVFTADHGMSDWGSHGDGHPDNTRTPLIAWGSGVAKPKTIPHGTGIAPGHEDGFSSDWGLDHVHRHDVAQADVAALMAYLPGLDFPVNSVGELPLDFLACDSHGKAESALVNARGILEMYRVKEQDHQRSKLRYRPFPALGDEAHSVDHRVAEIRTMIDKGDYEEAIQTCIDLMKIGLAGLRYLQTYDWLFLRTLITLGYLGWIAFALTTVIDVHVLHGQTQERRSTASTSFFSAILIALFSFLFMQQSSWTYYAYALFPVAFWEEVFARRQALWAGQKALIGHIDAPAGWVNLTLNGAAFVTLIQALVQSYFHREVFSLCYMLGAIWPASYGQQFLLRNRALVATWALSCVLMSVFTFLPVVKVESLALVMAGGAMMFTIGFCYLIFQDRLVVDPASSHNVPTGDVSSNPAIAADPRFSSRIILGIQTGLILLAMLVTRSSIISLSSKRGLPLGNQVVGWLTLILSVTVPFLHGLVPTSDHYLHRLVIIFLAFSPSFIILTISYEGLFYVVFSATLVTWIQLEHQIHSFDDPAFSPASKASTKTTNTPASPPYRALRLSDLRTALFSLFLLQSAFFSTGNIASISSFSLDAVYRLLPIFDPFSQGALLMLKIIIPFALLSANLAVLNRKLGVAPSALFMVVISVSDLMTLNFFWMVRDEGSWLDIGTSISHFCIGSALGIFVAALEGAGRRLVGGIDLVQTTKSQPLLARAGSQPREIS